MPYGVGVRLDVISNPSRDARRVRASNRTTRATRVTRIVPSVSPPVVSPYCLLSRQQTRVLRSQTRDLRSQTLEQRFTAFLAVRGGPAVAHDAVVRDGVRFAKRFKFVVVVRAARLSRRLFRRLFFVRRIGLVSFRKRHRGARGKRGGLHGQTLALAGDARRGRRGQRRRGRRGRRGKFAARFFFPAPASRRVEPPPHGSGSFVCGSGHSVS